MYLSEAEIFKKYEPLHPCVIVRTILPSEEGNFTLHLLFMPCAGCAWTVFIPLPLSQEVPVYGLVSLKLITSGTDMSAELEDELKDW